MRFASVQQILPESGRLAAAIRFYESIRELGNTRRNPHFWLQYAIACVTLGDLDRSGKYFETAYSLARARNWDTTQIDNHYARYLLETAIANDDPAPAMRGFRAARDLLTKQIKQQQRLHYPYRIARLYGPFTEKFAGQIAPAERTEVRDAVGRILDSISRLPESRRQQRYVRECDEALQYAALVLAEDTVQ